MNSVSFLKKIKKSLVCLNEADSLKYKLVLLKYFLQNTFSIKNTFYKSAQLSSEVRIKNRYGTFISTNDIHSVFGFSSLNEPLVKNELSLDKGVAIDIGANTGAHTILLGKRLNNSGRVIAIEPEPRNIKILNKNISLNNLDNVLVIRKACCFKKGKALFYLAKKGYGEHSLIKNNNNLNKIEVYTDKLDNILGDLGIKKVNLIKLDVEGSEADVLRGAEKTLKRDRPKIIFEAWNNNYLKDILKILNKFCYHIKKIEDLNYVAYYKKNKGNSD